MTKIDIFSGFLGAGKTTLIKKLVKEAFAGQQIVLIENEFGEIGIDGGFLQESGIQINELNSGCICCSLVGDFREALKKVVEQYHPDRILIEPSGVGKLSDVTRAVEGVAEHLPVQLNSFVTVADVNKVKLYMKNFGEFYNDQISHASCILLSRTQTAGPEKTAAAVAMIREKNPNATIVTTPWDTLEGAQIVTAMESTDDFVQQLRLLAEQANTEHAAEDAQEAEEGHEHHHHHHDSAEHDGHDEHDDDDDDDEDEHEHHHHDDDGDDDDGDEHEHHHHDGDDDDEDEHEHHHHYDENGVCSCGHHHHHHDGHDADEVFTSWGVETAKKFSEEDIRAALSALDGGKYGAILRAKGIVDGPDGWLEFDFVPGESEVRRRGPDVTGRLVVIGSQLDEAGVAALFGV
jgi:G3E family GTPase